MSRKSHVAAFERSTFGSHEKLEKPSSTRFGEPRTAAWARTVVIP